MGFGFVMNEIVKFSRENGEKYVLFSDDDIFGLKKRERGKLRNMKGGETQEFLAKAEEIMKEKDLAQLAVSFIGHNWYEKESIKSPSGCWGMVFLDVDKITEAGGYETYTKLFNDFELSARLLKKGYKTATWYDYAFEHKMDSMTGGAHDIYRKNEILKGYCKEIMKNYGDECKMIVSKTGKNELRFNWKKCARKIYPESK
jgi:hypothetical protein